MSTMEGFPLTTTQYAIWLDSLRSPDSHIYTLTGQVHTTNPYDLVNLEKAINTVLARHPQLRICLRRKGHEIRQLPDPARFRPLERYPYSFSSIDERESAIKSYINEPFDLENGPLFRFSVWESNDGSEDLVSSWHHLSVDGVSIWLVLKEIFDGYQGIDSDPPDPDGYRRYVEWEQEYMTSRDGENAVEYWRNELSGATPFHHLPTNPRTKKRFHLGVTETRFPLTEAVVDEEDYLPYEIALASYMILLREYSGRDDVLVAVPLQGRPIGMFESVVGQFANLGIIRVDFRSISWSRELLPEVRRKLRGAMRHQAYPFPSLLEKLGVSTPAGELPLTNAYCGFVPVSPLGYPGFSVHGMGQAGEPWDLSLEIFSDGNDTEVVIKCLEEVWDPGDENRIRDHFNAVLEDILIQNDRPIGRLTGIPPLDREAKRRKRDQPDTRRLILEKQVLTDTETAVTAIWQEVLGGPEVLPDEDFFSVGGHSLKATRVIARLSERFHVEIPIDILFRAPTVRELACWIETHEHQRLVTPNDGSTPVHRTFEGVDGYPLSFSQERMWFQNRFDPTSAAYNIGGCLRIKGFLDTNRLREAFIYLQDRHEALRTLYRTYDGVPRQHVRERAMASLRLITPSHGKADDILEETRRSAEEELLLPFDLTRDPPVRLTLFELGPEDAILLLAIHHIAADHWSLGIIARDLFGMYRAGMSKEVGRPRTDHFQYRDYAAAQRRAASDGSFSDARAYWVGRLANLPELELPMDHRRPINRTDRSGIARLPITPGLSAEIDRFCSNRGVTKFVFLLACYKALVHAITGCRDFGIGIPVSNRSHIDEETIVGTFINTVVHRGSVDPKKSFVDLLDDTRKAWTEDFLYRDYPFSLLVRDLDPHRNDDRSPLAQTLFNLLEDTVTGLSIEEATIVPFPLDAAGVQFDLSVTVDLDFGREIIFAYNRDVFAPESAIRWIAYFGRIVTETIRRSTLPIGEIPLLPAAERKMLLFDWNDTTVDRYAERSTPALIARAVEADRMAVISENGRMTYDELDNRSRGVANALEERGIGPGSVVGVYMEKRPELLATLLGVMISGAIYLPLDPSYPPRRLALMAESSDASLIIVDDDSKVPPPLTDRETIPVGSFRPKGGRRKPLDEVQTPDALAYVLYTSGSTGEPKGVEIGHGALANFLLSMREEPGFTPDDGLLSVTPISFDISGLELFLPLISGGTVHLLPDRYRRDPRAIIGFLDNPEITVMQATPAMWRMLLEAGWSGKLRKILCGGEPFPPDLVAPLFSRCDELWNLYGPTETTIWSARYKIPDAEARPFIGRPISNTQIHILDKSMEPVLPGTPGDLYIAGEGLARGYCRRPDLTRVSFLPHPWQKGERIYRTGDRARYRNDGIIEFIGRSDSQVKLRGFRVELGEVEGALMKIDSVASAVCDVRNYGPGDDLLVAYCVPKNPEEDLPDRENLANRLAADLPTYMIPGAFISVGRLPLTPAGKIDRSSLPNPRRPVDPGEEPVSPTEKQLAALWKRILHTEVDDRNVSFFDLGGHSLAAVRLTTLIEDQLGITIPLRIFFRDPTLRGTAAVIDAGSDFDESTRTESIYPPHETDVLFPMLRGGNRRPLYLVTGVHDEWDGVYRYLSAMVHHLGTDQPVFGLRPRGIIKPAPAYAHVREMAEEYLDEIKHVQPRGPYRIAGECIGGIVAYEMARIWEQRGETVEYLILMDTEYPRTVYQTIERVFIKAVSILRRIGWFSRMIWSMAWGPRDRSDGKRREVMDYLVDRRANPPPKTAEERERKRYRSVKARYLTNAHRYRPGAYGGTVYLLVSDGFWNQRGSLGWTKRSPRGGPGELRVVPIRGDHVTRLTIYGSKTADIIRGILDEEITEISQ